jgi:hypothetical protein
MKNAFGNSIPDVNLVNSDGEDEPAAAEEEG